MRPDLSLERRVAITALLVLLVTGALLIIRSCQTQISPVADPTPVVVPTTEIPPSALPTLTPRVTIERLPPSPTGPAPVQRG